MKNTKPKEKKMNQKESYMTYLEAREIVDGIIDDKRDVEVEGKMGVVIDYLLEQKRINDNKHNDRMERFDRLSKISAPDIILQNEVRMSGEHKGMADAYDDAIKVVKCIESFPEDMCQFQIMHTIDDSKRRGCRDCRYRFCNYIGGENFDSHFYCGMHAEMEEEEKEAIRSCAGIYDTDEDGQPCRKWSDEEVEADIAKGRKIFGDGGKFNKPCKHYAPAPRPLWKCTDKEIECAKRFIKTEIPDLEDEGWDEESVLMHMVFCKRNELSLRDAEKKILKRIFGEDEKGENNEDNT